MEVLANLLNWKAIIEILILWFVIYRIFLFLKGTKAVYLLRGREYGKKKNRSTYSYQKRNRT